jgi:hypothetical protein
MRHAVVVDDSNGVRLVAARSWNISIGAGLSFGSQLFAYMSELGPELLRERRRVARHGGGALSSGWRRVA